MTRIHLLAIALLGCLASACQGQATVPSTNAGAPAPAESMPGSPPAPAPAESTPGSPPGPSVPEPAPTASGPMVLQPGMTVDLAPRAKLTLDKVVSDSRCPKDVQCVWAGEVTLAFVLAVDAASEPFELSTHTAPRRTVKGFDVTLLDYGACPGGGPAVTPLPGECATVSVAVSP